MTPQTMNIGAIELTPISDGSLATSLDVVIAPDRAEIERLSGKKVGDPVQIAVNAFLFRHDGRWALIDTGAGNTMGPALGRLCDNLRALRVPTEDIETILLTHLHPDHSNGLVDGEGRAIYPNAELILHELEAGFWLDRDEAAGASERIRRNIAKAAVTTAPYRSRLRRVRDGEVMPGVSAVHLPGHTPGHTGWLLQSGGDGVLIWGDIVHLASIQIPRPDIGLAFDVDAPAACATRKRLFDRLAADRLKVAGAHMDFPGVGTVTRSAAGFRFEPLTPAGS
jgi:glyoxylase-like metal-dependent hydrolase (beta-lactamase superfamily II)